jgi:hypothetical protein
VQIEETRGVGICTTTRGSMSDRDGGVVALDLTQDEDAILSDSERVLSLCHSTERGAMAQIALHVPFIPSPSATDTKDKRDPSDEIT